MLIENQKKHLIQSDHIEITWTSKYIEKEMYIRLYGSCGTDLGRSIAEVTDNIHAIGVV